jgi:hypothetical protein
MYRGRRRRGEKGHLSQAFTASNHAHRGGIARQGDRDFSLKYDVHLVAGFAFPEDELTRLERGDAAHASEASYLFGVQSGEER